ncbi:unnamed protein product [Acanthoscelides obtectus]|uniref:Uncharacterized protein n=1 Tax=Acanthoscelides obtectus TaxID=200917 RepID=A0A9P0LS52_ACAOB|nr:unnamed protein product [Acanthoscelides obtectus]CAK1620540.1 hypothetical protein AOBTE_LOCUS435 [Acanthoscelides obtectus]
MPCICLVLHIFYRSTDNGCTISHNAKNDEKTLSIQQSDHISKRYSPSERNSYYAHDSCDE